jgi:hypothetical protein
VKESTSRGRVWWIGRTFEKEWERNERNYEDPGKVCEKEKAGKVNVEKTKIMVFNKRKRKSD